MVAQIALVVLVAALLFKTVRRWLKTGLGLVFGAFLVFALVTALAYGI